MEQALLAADPMRTAPNPAARAVFGILDDTAAGAIAMMLRNFHVPVISDWASSDALSNKVCFASCLHSM